jgi:hypothetical protein
VAGMPRVQRKEAGYCWEGWRVAEGFSAVSTDWEPNQLMMTGRPRTYSRRD